MTEIGLGHYLTLGAIIFTIGVVGIFLNRKNVIVILMSIELILLAENPIQAGQSQAQPGHRKFPRLAGLVIVGSTCGDVFFLQFAHRKLGHDDLTAAPKVHLDLFSDLCTGDDARQVLHFGDVLTVEFEDHVTGFDLS